MSLEPTVSRASDPSAMGTKLSSIIFVNDDFAIVKLSSSELDVTLEVPPPPPPPPHPPNSIIHLLTAVRHYLSGTCIFIRQL